MPSRFFVSPFNSLFAMLYWWSNLDLRERFFFSAALFLAVGGIFYFATGAILEKLITEGIIFGLVAMFCPKDDSTKI